MKSSTPTWCTGARWSGLKSDLSILRTDSLVAQAGRVSPSGPVHGPGRVMRFRSFNGQTDTSKFAPPVLDRLWRLPGPRWSCPRTLRLTRRRVSECLPPREADAMGQLNLPLSDTPLACLRGPVTEVGAARVRAVSPQSPCRGIVSGSSLNIYYLNTVS